MNISECKLAIMLCREASLGGDGRISVTPFLWAHRGIGKSSLVYQVCKDKRWGFIDFRASQIEGSDLRGYPDREKDENGNGVRTVFLPPADMPWGHLDEDKCPACDPEMDIDSYQATHGGRKRSQSTYCKGELFLDELPRAEDDVIQAAFQLVLDRAVGQYELPPGWHVVAAGNYLEGYTQNGFQDPAWINRFCHCTIGVTDDYIKEWTDYIINSEVGKDNDHSQKVLQFISFNQKHLHGDVKGDMGFTIQPSPRSWEMVLKVLKFSKSYPQKIVRLVIGGLVGMEFAQSFERFDISVTPQEIIQSGVKGTKTQLDNLNRNQLCGLVWGMAATAKSMDKSKEKMENVLEFMEWVATSAKASDARDLAVVLGRELMSSEVATLGGAMLSNPMLAKLAAKVTKKTLSWVELLQSNGTLAKIMSKVSYGKDD